MKPIERELSYYEEKPVMVLRPAARDNKNRFIIHLDDLWKYSDTHNEHFESFIANRVPQLCKLFDISVPKGEKAFAQLMSSVSSVIMDGIDDLVKMPPFEAGVGKYGTIKGKKPEPSKTIVG